MNLLNRKIRLFSISNIAVSFIITSFTGVTYYNTHETNTLIANESFAVEENLEPVSQLGDEGIVKETVVKNDTKKNSVSKKATVTKVVKKKEVATTTKYTPANYSSVTGNAVVEYAKKYLGLRYIHAGRSLSKGTDCSGFTSLIYREFGVKLPYTVSGQISKGTYVRKSDLQKGDLVFYANGNGKASHVSIYIGGGKVIHESNYRDGVKISSVNMMQYITARRVINSKAVKIVEEKLAAEKALNEEKNNTETTKNTDNQVVSQNNLDTKQDNNVGNNVNNSSTSSIGQETKEVVVKENNTLEVSSNVDSKENQE